MIDYHSQRQAILQQMEQITRMERGKLSAEYRVGKEGKKAGPYYKHQVWEDGRNHSCRVDADWVGDMREAMAGHARFQELADEYVEVTVAMTRCEQLEESKKNSRRLRRGGIGRPKSS